MKIVIVFVDVMDLKNVWVSTKKLVDFRLFLDTLQVCGIKKLVFIDGFTGEGFTGQGGETAVNDGESSTADLFTDLIVSVEVLTHVMVLFCLEVRFNRAVS